MLGLILAVILALTWNRLMNMQEEHDRKYYGRCKFYKEQTCPKKEGKE